MITILRECPWNLLKYYCFKNRYHCSFRNRSQRCRFLSLVPLFFSVLHEEKRRNLIGQVSQGQTQETRWPNVAALKGNVLLLELTRNKLRGLNMYFYPFLVWILSLLGYDTAWLSVRAAQLLLFLRLRTVSSLDLKAKKPFLVLFF